MRILEFEISCKDNANREQNKMNSFIFYAEVRLVFALGKDKEIPVSYTHLTLPTTPYV